MYDLFAFFLILFAVISVMITLFLFIDGFGKNRFFISVGLMISAVILYIFVDNQKSPENYIISKKIINTDVLKLGKTKMYELRFHDSLNVEIIACEIPLSIQWDYENYRVYLDSVKYIDIYSSSFDSSHYKLGKLIEE